MYSEYNIQKQFNPTQFRIGVKDPNLAKIRLTNNYRQYLLRSSLMPARSLSSPAGHRFALKESGPSNVTIENEMQMSAKQAYEEHQKSRSVQNI